MQKSVFVYEILMKNPARKFVSGGVKFGLSGVVAFNQPERFCRRAVTAFK